MTSKYRKKRTKRNKAKKGRQKGGFLNRYNFVYAERETINQAFKNLNASAPNLVKNLSNEANTLLQQGVKQLVKQTIKGGQQLEKIAPKILRSAIEDAYKAPFRLLGQLGKKSCPKLDRNLKKYA